MRRKNTRITGIASIAPMKAEQESTKKVKIPHLPKIRRIRKGTPSIKGKNVKSKIILLRSVSDISLYGLVGAAPINPFLDFAFVITTFFLLIIFSYVNMIS